MTKFYMTVIYQGFQVLNKHKAHECFTTQPKSWVKVVLSCSKFQLVYCFLFFWIVKSVNRIIHPGLCCIHSVDIPQHCVEASLCSVSSRYIVWTSFFTISHQFCSSVKCITVPCISYNSFKKNYFRVKVFYLK